MWLTNYFNYLFAIFQILLTPQQTAVQFPPYRKVTDVEVNTGTGSRSGINGNISHSQYSHPLDSIIIGAVGSLTTPAASQNLVSSQVIFGSGNAPVDAGDYKLESMFTSGLSFSIASGFDADNKSVVTNLTVTCTDAAKDVSEIGITYDQVLLYRKVLETPIHLEVGDSFIVKLSVDLGSGNATVSV